MRAARYHEYGNKEVLTVEEAEEPHAVAGSVRVAVKAVSINPIDYILREGYAKEILPLRFPVIPGRDAVGIVDEVGPGVEGTSVGDLVFGLGGVSDTTAEYVVLTAWAHVPHAWSVEQAAAAGLAAVTAAKVIEALGDLQGATVLIEGASGGVGAAVAAFALDEGARVIGTARAEKLGRLRELGLEAIAYGGGLSERVAEVAPDGVDVAVQAAPSASLPELVSIVGDANRVVTVIDTEGAQRLGARKVDAENRSDLVERAAELGSRGKYTPQVNHVLGLESIAKGHEIAQSGGGKVVITLA